MLEKGELKPSVLNNTKKKVQNIWHTFWIMLMMSIQCQDQMLKLHYIMGLNLKQLMHQNLGIKLMLMEMVIGLLDVLLDQVNWKWWRRRIYIQIIIIMNANKYEYILKYIYTNVLVLINRFRTTVKNSFQCSMAPE